MQERPAVGREQLGRLTVDGHAAVDETDRLLVWPRSAATGPGPHVPAPAAGTPAHGA